MANVKNFKTSKKTKLPKKPAVSLTDQQYEEIFYCAIYPSLKILSIQHPLKADLPGNEAISPTESAVIKDKQTNVGSNSIPHSEDLTSNKIIKLKTLESVQQATDKSESDSETASVDSSITGPPKKLSKRERLLWLQDKRGAGMYVRCDDGQCAKWRWLDNPDPVDLPPKWYCYMNPDKSLAACSVPEYKIAKDIEDDLVHNNFSPGSIVWAKMAGYPWWPAMVDDCPDCEQYYWINIYGDLVPDYYNVVFFDNNEVTRRWILVKNLKSYKHNLDFDKTFKLPLIYKKRMRLAKEKANSAIKLRIKDRLKRYSFVALWNEEIPEFLTSDDDDSDVDEADYEKKLKRKIIQRKRIHDNRRNSTDFNQAVRLNQNHSNNSVTLSHKDKSKIATKKLKQDPENSKPTKKVTKINEKSNIKIEINAISKSTASQKHILDEDKESFPQEKNMVKKNKNKDTIKTIAEKESIPRSNNNIDYQKNMSTDDKQSNKKQHLNKDLLKTIVEEKTIPRSNHKIDYQKYMSTDDKQSNEKQHLNKDLLQTIAEGKSIPSTNHKIDMKKNVSNDIKQSMVNILKDDKQSKGKENLNKDLPKTVIESHLKKKSSKKRTATSVDDSSSSEGIQIFRPVDRILDKSKDNSDRDLAQKAYDLCLNLFTSGKHGEAQFEKIYKIITKSNNNEILSPNDEIREEQDESSKDIPENGEEVINKSDNKNPTEISKTPKIRLLETSHDLLESKGQKRKIEDKLSKVVKVIKLAQKAHMHTIQNTVPSVSDILE